ncbi:M56 family metallopeptidase [Draconibacterium sp.]|nr:M56 family metallopeptidase [Draconibacterium sp.]
METLTIFLLKASAGIVLFYSVYWLFLRKETFYSANRWFLITALLTAILLPFFPIQYSVFVEPENSKTVFKSIADTFQNIPVITESESIAANFSWQEAVLLIYLTGVAIFMLRLITQTFILIHLMVKYQIKSLEGVRIVENEKYGLPFSFFNVIFINPKFHTQDNLPEILAHEKVHIRENHWFDLLFIELLTVIFWFNPFIWFFEQSIKQNHEYLADKGVLAQGHTVGRYQALLVNQLMGMQIIGITNNLNFALNTNRLKMMTKTKTSVRGRIKFLWTLPVLVLLLFAFAEPDYKAKDIEPQLKEISTQEVFSEKTLTISGKVVMKETGEPLPGATVVIKGSTVGTVVDRDGTFKLVDPNPEIENDGDFLSTTIVISFVGLRTIETKLGASQKNLEKQGQVNGTIKMEEAVIVIGTDIPPPPPPKTKPEKPVPPPPPPPPAKGEKEVFYIVEDMPKYPGGYEALDDYISKMQKKIAVSKKVKGKAKVAFTVNNKGKITDIKVVESDNDAAAKGAVMIASAMPEWTPGKQRGKPVQVKYLLPVEFK